VLYQYFLPAALNQQQTQYVRVFTTEMSARYLRIKVLSVINCHETTQESLPDEIQQYIRYVTIEEINVDSKAEYTA